MTKAKQWNRNPDGSPVTERDLEIAVLDGCPLSVDQILAEAERAVQRGLCKPDKQSRLDYAWDAVVRSELGRG